MFAALMVPSVFLLLGVAIWYIGKAAVPILRRNEPQTHQKSALVCGKCLQTYSLHYPGTSICHTCYQDAQTVLKAEYSARIEHEQKQRAQAKLAQSEKDALPVFDRDDILQRTQQLVKKARKRNVPGSGTD